MEERKLNFLEEIIESDLASGKVDSIITRCPLGSSCHLNNTALFIKRVGSIISYICLFVFCVSCEKKPCENPIALHKLNTQVDISEFTTRDALARYLTGDSSLTRSEEDSEFLTEDNLFELVEDWNIEEDPILSIDCQEMGEEMLIDEDDLTFYHACGYDTLVPDVRVARLLNIRGEIMVSDTIYKVSPKGTYYFHKDLINAFEGQYGEFESMEGIESPNGSYQLAEGIWRYPSFDGETWLFESDDEVESEDEDDSIQTRSYVEYRFESTIDWSKYPRYNNDKHSFFGKIMQSLVGVNRSFHFNFSNKERFSPKFYYYNYLFWQSSGVEAKMEKKKGLFWKAEKAEELYLGWKNIVYQMTISGSVPPAVKNTKPKAFSSNEVIPWTGGRGKASYVFGIEISDDFIRQLGKDLSNNTFSLLANQIKSTTGHTVSDSKIIKIFMDSKIVFVINDDGDYERNVSSLKHPFYSNKRFGFDDINLNNVPSEWYVWVYSIVKGTKATPSVSLVSGELRAACKYNGKVNAVSLYKSK